MTTGCEFYTSDTNLLQFSSVYTPYIFFGKVNVGTNAGALQQSTAKNQDGLAPTMSNVEQCEVACPANSVQVAVTGNKLPSGISINKRASDGQWICYFTGLRDQSCSLYFFGQHPGTSSGGSQGNLEFYNSDGSKVIYSVRDKMMIARSGIIDSVSSVQVPSGRNYGMLVQVYGVSKSAPFVGPSSQGNRQYVNYLTYGGYASGGYVGMNSFVRDIERAADTDYDYEVIRNNRGMIIDLTGLG